MLHRSTESYAKTNVNFSHPSTLPCATNQENYIYIYIMEMRHYYADLETWPKYLQSYSAVLYLIHVKIVYSSFIVIAGAVMHFAFLKMIHHLL